MKKTHSNTIRKSRKENSSKNVTRKTVINTNIILLNNLLKKNHNNELDKESKKKIVWHLKETHMKKWIARKDQDFKDKEDLMNVFIYELKYSFTKNTLLDHHHGFKTLNIDLNLNKIFLSILIRILHKNRLIKMNIFFTKLMILKTQETFRIIFLNKLNNIFAKNDTEKKRVGFYTIKSFFIAFDIFNKIYKEKESEWKKATFKILENFEEKPRLIFSIANKNPFYFKFLTFFKQMHLLIQRRKKKTFDEFKQILDQRRLEKKLLVGPEIKSKIFIPRIKNHNYYNENSNFTNSIEKNVSQNYKAKEFFDDFENDFEKKKSFKLGKILKNSNPNSVSDHPENLLNESKFSEGRNQYNENDKGNKQRKKLDENISNLKIQKLKHPEVFYEEINSSYINKNLIGKNKSHKISNNYYHEENINKSNIEGEQKKKFPPNNSEEISSFHDTKISQNKKFNYKSLIAKKQQKSLLKNELYQLEIISKRKKGSKILCYILTDLILKRLKIGFFYILNTKRLKKSEKIIYAKVQSLKRPIQYKIDVNEEDLRSMNMPISNGNLSHFRISNLNRSKPKEPF